MAAFFCNGAMMQLARILHITHNSRMSDDTSQPPPKPQRPPQESAQGVRPRRRPAPPPPPSRESRFIGYLVLGFGLLAVIAVLILAMGKKDESSQAADAQKQTTTGDLRAALSASTPRAVKPPKQELFFERDADLNADRMHGNWQASIGRYTAVLQLRKDVYQLILASSDPNAPRIYSSGTYKVIEDIAMLTPNVDWPTPAVPQGRVVIYNKMTRAPFPVLVKFEGDQMLWQNVPASEKRVRGPYTSPLFMTEKVKVAFWKKL